jgi:hypothetical protein
MINALAYIRSVGIPYTPPMVSYYVIFFGMASDGTTAKYFGDGSPSNGRADIPFGTNPKKANDLVRQAMAASVLTDTGFTIDPDDIYVPFS